MSPGVVAKVKLRNFLRIVRIFRMTTVLLLLYLLKLHKVFWNPAIGIIRTITESKKIRENRVLVPTFWHDAV